MVNLFRLLRKKSLFRLLRKKSSAGRLEGNCSEFWNLFPAEVSIRRVATGFRFTEGPLWLREESSLLFSDIPADCIWKWSPGRRPEIFRQPSAHANGITRDREGRLIVCEHGSRSVSRMDNDGSVTLASSYDGKRLNSPNDVVVRTDGSIYFTDPPFGIDPKKQEQPVQGVYRISPSGKEITLVVGKLGKPNGLAFSLDETILYIADSQGRNVWAFDLRHDGTLWNGRQFIDMNIATPGTPDGMKVDLCGNIFCAGPGGVWVCDPFGKHLGTIHTPEIPSNCAWGDSDWKTLFITARTSVYSVRLIHAGIPVAAAKTEL